MWIEKNLFLGSGYNKAKILHNNTLLFECTYIAHLENFNLSLIDEKAFEFEDDLVYSTYIKNRYKFHSINDLPASISYYRSGKVFREMWYKNGLQGRYTNLPSIKVYTEDEKIFREIYIKNGKFHRENDLPTVIDYYEDGSIKAEIWYKEGAPHRHKKPAIINYNENKEIINVVYATQQHHDITEKVLKFMIDNNIQDFTDVQWFSFVYKREIDNYMLKHNIKEYNDSLIGIMKTLY